MTLARGPGGANQHGRAVLSTAVVAELLPVAALPQIDGRAMLYSVRVSAGLLVAVVATDQCFACDDAVLVVKLDAIAVGGEKRSLAKKFVVLEKILTSHIHFNHFHSNSLSNAGSPSSCRGR